MGEFSYELPDSLLKLELPECGLTKVRIHAPRLTSTDILRNKLPSLTPSRLPKSLTKLIACGDSISSFGGDLKDLENLEEVYLAKNKLRGYLPITPSDW
ncbi:hypothetical protein Cantr_05760 [Candida viswanathii]|uniref:Uncharacterized protein n=1 Tax=Candida viswanathii TaxID=5486 RepID=A0A367XS95_9ASCO|nr:hypothetical protein Cantr_05760 [Candida viswanathii]